MTTRNRLNELRSLRSEFQETLTLINEEIAYVEQATDPAAVADPEANGPKEQPTPKKTGKRTPQERERDFSKLLHKRRKEAEGTTNGLPWQYQPQASPWR